jgi:dCTP deaminase
MVVNGKALLAAQPIRDMEDKKVEFNGVSYGLSEAGYDIRLKQDIRFSPDRFGVCKTSVLVPGDSLPSIGYRRFLLASAMEEFTMPADLVGIVHDKSTWARKGLSVFNTVIEPGWHGFLTLELVYHGWEDLHIPEGSGIAQVVFHHTTCSSEYDGKYQNQADEPVDSIFIESNHRPRSEMSDFEKAEKGFPYG